MILFCLFAALLAASKWRFEQSVALPFRRQRIFSIRLNNPSPDCLHLIVFMEPIRIVPMCAVIYYRTDTAE